MNSAQKQQIIEIISNDANLRFSYINDLNQSCVIGGLALAFQ